MIFNKTKISQFLVHPAGIHHFYHFAHSAGIHYIYHFAHSAGIHHIHNFAHSAGIHHFYHFHMLIFSFEIIRPNYTCLG